MPTIAPWVSLAMSNRVVGDATISSSFAREGAGEAADS